jgi:hypothetical protein
MMDASIQEYMRAESITVASVGLVYDQELVWEKGYGLTDPSSPSSYVHVCALKPKREASLTHTTHPSNGQARELGHNPAHWFHHQADYEHHALPTPGSGHTLA